MADPALKRLRDSVRKWVEHYGISDGDEIAQYLRDLAKEYEGKNATEIVELHHGKGDSA